MHNRPFAVLGVVLLLVVGLLGTPVLGQPDEPVTLQRVAAGDRIGTAVAVSQRFFPTADHVVLARADGFADALAGSPLAGLLGAPVLLTAPNALPTVVAEEITRLGATAATILGGEAAVGEAVADQLSDAGLVVERLRGALAPRSKRAFQKVLPSDFDPAPSLQRIRVHALSEVLNSLSTTSSDCRMPNRIAMQSHPRFCGLKYSLLHVDCPASVTREGHEAIEYWKTISAPPFQ